MDHDERALRQRVESAIRYRPDPDPAKFAAIRARLATRRGSDRRHLWLAAVLSATLGSTAVAALWIQSEREPEPATDEQAGPDEEPIDGAIPDESSEPAIETAPAQPESNGEDRSDPVIFRE